ncbi:MAG: DUF2249 domain-containing protein [Variovorax sp.]|nr:MAG: DUF2249 domain-containing protein [Variovorax sp.]
MVALEAVGYRYRDRTASKPGPGTVALGCAVSRPRDRHPLIFSTFDALAPGQSLQLVNDHDPKPLHYRFDDRCAGAFEWTYLESGPVLWRVQIGKLAVGTAQVASNSCCSGGAGCS